MENKKKLDIKLIFIIILGVGLILSLVFRRGKPIEKYESEIKNLHAQNDSLLKQNDKLDKINDGIDIKLGEIFGAIELNNDKISDTEIRIKDLQKRRYETSSNVATFNADGVANGITKYLKGRK